MEPGMDGSGAYILDVKMKPNKIIGLGVAVGRNVSLKIKNSAK